MSDWVIMGLSIRVVIDVSVGCDIFFFFFEFEEVHARLLG